MKRPALLTAVAAAHLFMGVLTLGVVIYLIYLTRAPETLRGKNAADTIHGLWIGAGVLLSALLPLLAAGWGLWRARRWGWILALVSDAVFALSLMSDLLERHVDTESLAVAAPFVVFLVVLLLPTVRRFVFKKSVSPDSVLVTS